ncbi:hypothetical protein V6N13_132662 [Hibiscus sabdariffa]
MALAQAEARSIRHDRASSASRKAEGSSSRADKRNPKELVDSSFRRIPPSTSNPIGNKFHPSLQGERSRRQQIPTSLKH